MNTKSVVLAGVGVPVVTAQKYRLVVAELSAFFTGSLTTTDDVVCVVPAVVAGVRDTGNPGTRYGRSVDDSANADLSVHVEAGDFVKA